MQIGVVEFARNVLGIAGANSSEFDENASDKVIDLMADQHGNLPKGGTMRLGAYPARIADGSLLQKLYGADELSERHRHRYEFNNAYRGAMEEKGLVISATSPDNRLVEAIELPANDFFVGVQFHPEFKSRPNRAHPVFRGFVEAALRRVNLMPLEQR
jgi:CTP synthase